MNWYCYGFRMYDPAIGRFPSVDPIADQFAFVSPFNYAENRPINGIDLHGLQYVDINEAERGQSGPIDPLNSTSTRGTFGIRPKSCHLSLKTSFRSKIGSGASSVSKTYCPNRLICSVK
ncbi:MAG: RHS repeat-associated core domain-containing protein [Bacteroidota bacterium]